MKLVSQIMLVLVFSSLLTAAQNIATKNVEFIINIEGDSIAAYGMFSSQETAQPMVIFMHGLPGNERNLDIAQALRRIGYHCLYFNYRGSWGSQGAFNHINSLQDAMAVIDFFSQAEQLEAHNISPKQFILIGHSYGGGLALIAGAKDERVKRIIALSASNLAYEVQTGVSEEDLNNFHAYLNSQVMLNCKPKEFTTVLFQNLTSLNALTYVAELEVKQVLLIDDFNREKSWPGELGDAINYKVIPSDHSFSNKRIELISAITNWLEN